MNDSEQVALQEEASERARAERYMLFIIAPLVILLDQITKRIIEAWLPLNHSWAPFPEFAEYFQITHVSNTGAAFGLFPGGSLFFTAIAGIVAVVIVIYNYRIPAGHRLLRLALALQLGGALGNLLDRLRLGHVTDFLDVGPIPVFNVADMAVVSGVIILGFLMLLEERAAKKVERLEAEVAPEGERGEGSGYSTTKAPVTPPIPGGLRSHQPNE